MQEDSLLQFPCDLPIKVFGRNVAGFRESVVQIVNSHCSALTDQIREQLSRDSGYTSLTITIQADSREQVDALYQELCESDDIMMVL
ncbi:MAG: YbeD family protein [Candidatus Rariloculaceae bacterium]